MAGHFQDYIHAGPAGGGHHLLVDVVFRGIEDVVGLHLRSEFAPVFVDFQCKDLAGPASPGYGDAEETDGPGADHGYGLGRDLAREGGMHGVAQGIEHAGVVWGNRRIDLPDVRFRDLHELGEGAVRIHSDDPYVLADVGLAGAALVALAAGDVHLRGDKVAFLHGGHLLAPKNNVTAEFVPGN